MRLFAPPILAGLVAAGTVLPIQADAATAACLTKPGDAAPQGSHWYYRMDRAANRKCWFLAESAKATTSAVPTRLPSARSRSVALMSRVAADGAAAETTVGAAAPAAAAGVAEAMIGESNNTMEFSKRWPARPRSAGSIGRDPLPVSSNDADEQATAETQDETSDDVPLLGPVLAAAEVTAAEKPPRSAISLEPTPAFLAGVLTLAAIFGAAMTFSAARGPRRDRPAAAPVLAPPPAPEANASCARERVAPAFGSPGAAVPGDAAGRQAVSVPRRAAIDRATLRVRDPDHDVEDRLWQLLQDWRRVAA